MPIQKLKEFLAILAIEKHLQLSVAALSNMMGDAGSNNSGYSWQGDLPGK